jgi:hypothetical protein
MSSKSEAFTKFLEYNTSVERQSNKNENPSSKI